MIRTRGAMDARTCQYFKNEAIFYNVLFLLSTNQDRANFAMAVCQRQWIPLAQIALCLDEERMKRFQYCQMSLEKRNLCSTQEYLATINWTEEVFTLIHKKYTTV